MAPKGITVAEFHRIHTCMTVNCLLHGRLLVSDPRNLVLGSILQLTVLVTSIVVTCI